MINVEIIKVYAGQILPCGQVTGNKEFTIGGVRLVCTYVLELWYANTVGAIKRVWRQIDRLENRFVMYWFMSRTTKYITFYAWTNKFTCLSN